MRGHMSLRTSYVTSLFNGELRQPVFSEHMDDTTANISLLTALDYFYQKPYSQRQIAHHCS